MAVIKINFAPRGRGARRWLRGVAKESSRIVPEMSFARGARPRMLPPPEPSLYQRVLPKLSRLAGQR